MSYSDSIANSVGFLSTISINGTDHRSDTPYHSDLRHEDPADPSLNNTPPPSPPRFRLMLSSMIPFALAFILLVVSATQSEWIDFQVVGTPNPHIGNISVTMDYYAAPFSTKVCGNVFVNSTNAYYPYPSGYQCVTHSLSNSDLSTWQNNCDLSPFMSIMEYHDECYKFTCWTQSRSFLIAAIILNGITAIAIPIYIRLLSNDYGQNDKDLLGILCMSLFVLLTSGWSAITSTVSLMDWVAMQDDHGQSRFHYAIDSSQVTLKNSISFGFILDIVGTTLCFCGFLIFCAMVIMQCKRKIQQ